MQLFNDDWLDSLSPKERKLWIEMQEVRRLYVESRRLHDATARLCARAEQANIAHQERELDEAGRPVGKTWAQEEIEHDEWKREEERKYSREAVFGSVMKQALEIVGNAAAKVKK